MGVDEHPVATRASRRRRRLTDDGRRTLSAGHALVIALLALLIASLLDAPHMHKTAYNQPQSWKREVALAITGPLAVVSHALLLDRPRKAVQWAVGRSGEDRIDTAVTFTPPPRTTPRATRPRPVIVPTRHTQTSQHAPKPRREAFSPKRKLRLWIAGDSLVIEPGWAIIRAAGRAHSILPIAAPDGRVATGLERPDVFNWFAHIGDVLREKHPQAVVLDFGGNDDHAYMTGIPDGVSIGDFGTPSWRREYRRRVAGVMDTINRAGGFVVWIGLPITRDEAQTERFDTINAIVEAEARKRKGKVAYIDTFSSFASESGGFAQYLTDTSGKRILVRSPDGVHFERAGGDMIARMVLHALNQQFDLTSWRRRKA